MAIGSVQISEQYRKGNKEKFIELSLSREFGYSQANDIYIDGTKEGVVNSYNTEEKIAYLNEPNEFHLTTVKPYFIDKIHTIGDLLKEALDVRITTTNYLHFGKEIECYQLDWEELHITRYIEKQTGLELRSIAYGKMNDNQYVFDKVSDITVTEPDLSSYEVHDFNEEEWVDGVLVKKGEQ